MVGQSSGNYSYGNLYGQPGVYPPPGYMLVRDPGMGAVTQTVTQNRISIPARFMDLNEKIMSNEVPSDGTVSLFIQKDYKAIYAKQANDRGTIDTVKYVPELPTVTEETQSPNAIEERFSKMEALIEERFSKIEKMLNKRNYYKKVYKPVQNQTSESEE